MSKPMFGDPWLDSGRPVQTAALAIHAEKITDVDGLLAFMTESAEDIREGRAVRKVDVVLSGVELGPVEGLETFWNGDVLRLTVRFDSVSVRPVAQLRQTE